MPRMNEEEFHEFLNTGVICRLGCVDGDGHPYVVPCWFQYADGGYYIIPRERSAWARYLQTEPRCSLCIDREDGKRALIKGTAALIEEPNVGGKWVEIAREMAYRYRGEAGLEYLDQSINEPRWLFFVRPLSTTTWSGGGWASKYKQTEW